MSEVEPKVKGISLFAKFSTKLALNYNTLQFTKQKWPMLFIQTLQKYYAICDKVANERTIA